MSLAFVRGVGLRLIVLVVLTAVVIEVSVE